MNIKPIKTDTDYKVALKRIEALWDAVPNTKKGDELSILAILVETFESEKYKILPPDPIEAIKFRMEQTGLKKTDLARYLGGRISVRLSKNKAAALRLKMGRRGITSSIY